MNQYLRFAAIAGAMGVATATVFERLS